MINYQKFIDDSIDFIKAIKYLGPVESEFIKVSKSENENEEEGTQNQDILILINETEKCTIMYEDYIIEDLMAINIKSDKAELEFKDGAIRNIILSSGYLQIKEYPPTAQDEEEITIIEISKKEYPDYVYMDRSKLRFPVTKTEMTPRVDGSYVSKISAYLTPRMLNPVPIYATTGDHSKLPRILNEIAVIAFDVANTEIQFIENGYIIKKDTAGFVISKIISFENNGIYVKPLATNNSNTYISYMDVFKWDIPIIDPNCVLVDCSDYDDIKYIDPEVFNIITANTGFKFTEYSINDFSNKLIELFNTIPSQNKLLRICSDRNIEKETPDSLTKILSKIEEAFDCFNQIITDYPVDDFLSISGQSVVRINNTSLNSIYNEAYKYIDNYLNWLRQQQNANKVEEPTGNTAEEVSEESEIKEAIGVEEELVETVDETASEE